MKIVLIFVLKLKFFTQKKLMMKNKLKLMQADFVLQSLAIVAVVISVIFIDKWRLDDAFVFTLFVLAGIQVISNLFLGFKYDDKRRKGYLKVLFWVQGVGSFVMLILGFLGVSAEALITFFYICWIFIPFFMVFWSLFNSWKGMQDAKLELDNHFSSANFN
jgi:hypothetical protein